MHPIEKTSLGSLMLETIETELHAALQRISDRLPDKVQRILKEKDKLVRDVTEKNNRLQNALNQAHALTGEQTRDLEEDVARYRKLVRIILRPGDVVTIAWGTGYSSQTPYTAIVRVTGLNIEDFVADIVDVLTAPASRLVEPIPYGWITNRLDAADFAPKDSTLALPVETL
jgi:hypothetical protein